MARGASYPQVSWSANDRALTWELITILEENNYLKRAIWRGPEEATVGKTKTTTYKELAIKLFGEKLEYRNHMKLQAGKDFYATSVKGQIGRIESAYKKAKQELGVTGAGLLTENEIWPNSELSDKWHQIKATCPYFYRLRDLLGERFNVSDHCITNSAQDLPEIDDLMTRRAGETSVLEDVDGTDEVKEASKEIKDEVPW